MAVVLYGAMNFPIKPLADEIEKIAGLGFDYLELAMDPPCAHYTTINRSKTGLLQSLGQYDLKLVCHLPCFVYTGDLTPSIRDASLNEMLASLDTASDLGAMKVVLHPSAVSGMGAFVRETAGSYAMESLHAIVERAGELGIRLCFENMFPRYMNCSEPMELSAVFNRFPSLRMTLDTGHANIGDPTGNRIFDFIQAFGDRIDHIHVSDNFGKIDDHLPVGRASINFSRFARAIRAMGYNKTITLEVFSDDPRDLVRSRDTISALLGEGPGKA
ncbi:MAG: sugar phosphate isomerase/epimerase [Pseudomonadota bacterium]